MHEQWRLEDHTRGEKQWSNQNPSGEGERSERKVFGSREKERNEIWYCAKAI